MPHEADMRRPDIQPLGPGLGEGSFLLLRLTRRHANVLGAYLSGRNEIAPLPEPLREILDALTLRLVGPPGSRRWADLRRALDGAPFLEGNGTTLGPVYNRPRRPYNTPLDDPDLRTDLLGDADGTTMAEWPEKPETD